MQQVNVCYTYHIASKAVVILFRKLAQIQFLLRNFGIFGFLLRDPVEIGYEGDSLQTDSVLRLSVLSFLHRVSSWPFEIIFLAFLVVKILPNSI